MLLFTWRVCIAGEAKRDKNCRFSLGGTGLRFTIQDRWDRDVASREPSDFRSLY